MEQRIPVLEDAYRIKGSRSRPRLVNIRTGKVISLKDQAIVDLLRLADGTRSLRDISRVAEGLTDADAERFFSKFEAVGALRFLQSPHPYKAPIDLSPAEPWLKEIHLDITSNCSLRCRHCFWGDNLGATRDVPFEVWDAALRQLADYGVLKVVLSGGEVLLRRDLDLFVKHITDYGMYLGAIFTNGSVWSDSFSRALQHIQELGIHVKIYVSLDGWTEIQHGFLRGAGTFAKTVKFVERLVAFRQRSGAPIHIAINSFIHRLNYTSLIPWYAFVAGLGVDAWRFETGMLVGNLAKNREDILAPVEGLFASYRHLIEYLIETDRCGPGHLEVNIQNYFKTEALRGKKIYIFDRDLPICDYKKQALAVGPQGDVRFCASWQSQSWGNLFRRNIDEIWQDPHLRRAKEFKVGAISECGDCKLLKYCGGGCRLMATTLEAKDLTACAHFEYFERCIVPLLEKSGIELAVG